MIRIEIDDREVRQALENLRRRSSNMKQAMHAIGQALVEGSRDRILAGRDWTGQPCFNEAAANSPRIREGGQRRKMSSSAMATKAAAPANDPPSAAKGAAAAKNMMARVRMWAV
jgi:multidrug resistance efflux pump